MKAFQLTRHGTPEKAFELIEAPDPTPSEGEVRIEVEAFGLNFADVMARLGYYQDCPPLPTIIGYDVVGRVTGHGEGVNSPAVGTRVVTMTRFGGYASQVTANARAVAEVPEDLDACAATALATQYCTAYYAAEICTTVHPEDHVLIQAAAGGVGTALIQLLKPRGCTLYGTASAEDKLEYLRSQGVHHPINYAEQDFAQYIREQRSDAGIDVAFDAVGGKSVKKTLNLLAPGGRAVLYGASTIAGKGKGKSLMRQINTAAGFGFYNPIRFMMQSQTLATVNMLRVADHQPHVLERCIHGVMSLYKDGKLNPVAGKTFPAEELTEAHNHLTHRQSIGKVAVKWQP